MDIFIGGVKVTHLAMHSGRKKGEEEEKGFFCLDELSLWTLLPSSLQDQV